jgi:hypothetical protein
MGEMLVYLMIMGASVAFMMWWCLMIAKIFEKLFGVFSSKKK